MRILPELLSHRRQWLVWIFLSWLLPIPLGRQRTFWCVKREAVITCLWVYYLRYSLDRKAPSMDVGSCCFRCWRGCFSGGEIAIAKNIIGGWGWDGGNDSHCHGIDSRRSSVHRFDGNFKTRKKVCQLEVRQPFYCFQVRNWFKVRSNERRRRKGKSLAPAETEKGEFVKIYASGEGRKERLNLWVSLEYQVLSPPFGRKTTTTDLSLRYCHELLSLSPKKEKGSSPHLCILLSEGEAQEVRQLILISRRKREKSK